MFFLGCVSFCFWLLIMSLWFSVFRLSLRRQPLLTDLIDNFKGIASHFHLRTPSCYKIQFVFIVFSFKTTVSNLLTMVSNLLTMVSTEMSRSCEEWLYKMFSVVWTILMIKTMCTYKDKQTCGILTNMVEICCGNSLERMANPAIMKADVPSASTDRQAKHSAMNGLPDGHLLRVLKAQKWWNSSRKLKAKC